MTKAILDALGGGSPASYAMRFDPPHLLSLLYRRLSPRDSDP